MAGTKFKLGRKPKRHRCSMPQARAGRSTTARGGHPRKNKRYRQHVIEATPDSTQCNTVLSLNETLKLVTLPPHWTITSTSSTRDDTAMNIGKLVSIPSDIQLRTQPLVVTHCITVRDDFSWKVFVHGYCVNSSTSPLLSSFPKQLDLHSLTSLIATLDSCTVCPGHPDKHFVDMLTSRGGKISSHHGNDVVARLDTFAPVELNGEWYNQTVRSNACRIISNDTKCDKCVMYRDSLTITGVQKQNVCIHLKELLLPVRLILASLHHQSNYNITNSLKSDQQQPNKSLK